MQGFLLVLWGWFFGLVLVFYTVFPVHFIRTLGIFRYHLEAGAPDVTCLNLSLGLFLDA